MTIKKAIVAGIGLTLLNACTTLEERQRANGEYVYLGEAEAKHFVVPEGLDAPEFSSDYELPALGSDADASLLGDKLTIHSPALVRASNERGLRNNRKAKETMFFFLASCSTPTRAESLIEPS